MRLYCCLRHLDGKRCARPRDICFCVHAVVRDCMEQSLPRRAPSVRLLQQLAMMELDMVTNGQASPFFGGDLPE